MTEDEAGVLRGENHTLRKMAERIAALVDCLDPICLTALAENDEETTADLLVKAVTRHGERLRAEVARLTATTADAVKLAEMYQNDLIAARAVAVANADLWKAEREAHAQTKAERDGSMALMDHYRVQAETFRATAVEQQVISIERRDRVDRAEAVLRGLRDEATRKGWAEVVWKLDELERA